MESKRGSDVLGGRCAAVDGLFGWVIRGKTPSIFAVFGNSCLRQPRGPTCPRHEIPKTAKIETPCLGRFASQLEGFAAAVEREPEWYGCKAVRLLPKVIKGLLRPGAVGASGTGPAGAGRAIDETPASGSAERQVLE